MRTLKAQSAMEYLMTYGWAILIIAVVLGALFSLGVFSGASLLGTTCIASSGYLCSGLIWSHTNGLQFTFGQSTGVNWAGANIFYVPSGTAAPSSVPSTCVQSLGSFNSGQSTPVTLTGSCYGTTVSGLSSVGATTAGALWAEYQTAAGGTQYFTQVATLTAKAS
ncbi:MAG: hypothetical protein ACP5K9_00805 [Candidatus Micrarchaeia archaeon]